ncbi:hypothetical protein [Erythrobacter sp. JK5]|uniref:hypothetical protein n=1 Tax=Erythrobacter sp. JK5 TaxID=2829500 RepID=UPI001BA6082E|nr:hypothetical protein [Erythrobacter sp. JK5]QUL36557.1 hypothetical protein KDC96_08885 [Erythrobacter sp. JK5]
MAEQRSNHTIDMHEGEREGAPLGGNRAEAVQRLQVGLFGLFSMVLVVGLASVINNSAQQAEAAAVPEAAPTTEPTEAPPQRDPLADAGVVPDIPAEPDPNATTVPDIAPAEGTRATPATNEKPAP